MYEHQDEIQSPSFPPCFLQLGKSGYKSMVITHLIYERNMNPTEHFFKFNFTHSRNPITKY